MLFCTWNYLCPQINKKKITAITTAIIKTIWDLRVVHKKKQQKKQFTKWVLTTKMYQLIKYKPANSQINNIKLNVN